MIAECLTLEEVEKRSGSGKQSGVPTPQYVQEVWARRAARLAQVPRQETAGERISLVLVQLASEIYGLEAQYVFDIRPVQHITPVPRAPKWVAGIANLRGRIISVLDLRHFFDLPIPHSVPVMEQEHSAATSQYLVVVKTQGAVGPMEIALLTDTVLTVHLVPVSQVQPVTDMLILNIRPDYVRGFIPYDGQANVGWFSDPTPPGELLNLHAEQNHSTLLVILNLPALLADKRLIVDEDL